MPLIHPAANFSTLTLHTINVEVTSLYRIGRHKAGEPYFGKNNSYRFDDPLKGFGTCYCGQHLDTAIAESILHDEIPSNGEFRIHDSDFSSRYLMRFDVGVTSEPLIMADMRGVHLKRLGADNGLSAEHPYDTTKIWSAALHAHPSNIDGFVFVSKQLNNRPALVVFDRAQHKFGSTTYTPLHQAIGITAAMQALGIVIFS